METYDDDLRKFEPEGAPALPVANDYCCMDHEGARIWYATYGSDAPVILLREPGNHMLNPRLSETLNSAGTGPEFVFGSLDRLNG